MKVQGGGTAFSDERSGGERCPVTKVASRDFGERERDEENERGVQWRDDDCGTGTVCKVCECEKGRKQGQWRREKGESKVCERVGESKREGHKRLHNLLVTI